MASTERPHLFLLLFLSSSSLAIKDGELKSESAGLIRVKAVGRSAPLGTTYNEVTETFTGISIFNQSLPASYIKSTATPYTNTKYGVLRIYIDMSLLLGISAGLTLQLKLAGAGPPGGTGSGGGSFSSSLELRAKWNSVVGMINYETLTYEDIIKIYYDNIKDYLSEFVFNTTTDTHVVIGVGWGANVLCKFEDINAEFKAAGALEVEMNAGLSELVFNVNGKAFVNSSLRVSVETYHFELAGDIFFEGAEYPANATQLVKFIRQIPKMVNASNSGKGRALFYYLLPIEKIRDFVGWKPPPLPEELPNNTLAPIVLPPRAIADALELFEEIDIVKYKLEEVFRLCMSNRDVLTNRDLRKLLKLRRDFNNQTEEYIESLGRAVVNTRQGLHSDPVHFISKIINRCRNDDTELERIENMIDNDFRDQLIKIHFAELIRKQVCIWSGRTEGVDTYLMKLLELNGLENMIVCRMKYHRAHLHSPIHFLQALLANQKNNRTMIIVVDCDFPQRDCEDTGYECKLLYEGHEYDPETRDQLEQVFRKANPHHSFDPKKRRRQLHEPPVIG